VKIAIIGSGIAGNVVAQHLYKRHDVHIFEAASHIGGHAHTHDVEVGGRPYTVDTGFIVYNEQTYPQFSSLLRSLGVASQESSMSFSVRCERSGLEYNGTTIDSLFAQRRNLLRPGFWRMIREILRFNREAPALLHEAMTDRPDIALGQYLRQGRYSREFIDWYIVPMGAAIWSTDPVRMLDFPARCFVRFFHNHGMLSVNDRPQWRTVAGGSREYVRRLTAPFAQRIRLNTPVLRIRRLATHVEIATAAGGVERFDQVFMACHSDQALALLEDATPLESATLGAIPYQASQMVLHTDASLLPRRRKAWAAWNYHLLPDALPCQHAVGGSVNAATVTYNMNILQRISAPHTFCVTLNRPDDIDPSLVLKRLTYHHPVYTPEGLAAQGRHWEVNGVRRTYFCGAYWRYGFHEDGVASALAALEHFEKRASVEVPRAWQQGTEQPRAVRKLGGNQVGHPGLAL
jgi:predicted NAD/FAD-binding protein